MNRVSVPTARLRCGGSSRLLAVGLLAFATTFPLRAASAAHQFGPTGLQGDVTKTTITVTQVAKGSPADGQLKVSDQIIGAGGARFQQDVRRELAAAIDVAESEAAGGKLTLLLADDQSVELQLPVLGSYSETAPYRSAKTDAIITRAADYLVTSGRYAAGDLANGWLGLMATGDPKYIEVVKRELPKQKWAQPDMEDLLAVVRGEKDAGYVSWYWGYRLITLAEYHLLTGDESALPAIEAYAVALAMGQDASGLWGHRMANYKLNDGIPHGRLPGYAQINQPSLTCFIGMLLARKCGVDHPELTAALAKTQAFYHSFVGRGALPYGVHEPKTQFFNNNGTSATAALALAFAGDQPGAAFFSQLAAASYDGLETGHATYYFNVLWTPLGASLAGPEVTTQFFHKTRWLQTLYRKWDGSFDFDEGECKAGNSTGAYLLAACLPRRALYITGKNADESLWLKAQAATAAIDLSQIDYQQKSPAELIALFGHPIPQVTRRAVWALRDKPGDFAPQLVPLMKAGTKVEKLSAIGYFGYGCPKATALPRLADLGDILRDGEEDPEVRAAAASALSWLGEPAYAYYEDMLRLIVADEPNDIFQATDESVGQSLVNLCKDPFQAGLVKNKELSYTAVLKLMDHKRQSARTSGVALIAAIPLEDFHFVADKLQYILADRDRTYHSYHGQGPRGAAISVLVNLNIDEGLQYLPETLDLDTGKWGFKVRMLMSVLPKYGAHAKPVLEKLQADPRLKDVENGKFGGAWRAMVKAIEEDQATGKLITFEEAKQAGLNK